MKHLNQGAYSHRLPRGRRAKRFLGRTIKRWRGLSWRKKILVVATPLVLFVLITPIVTYLYFAKDISDIDRLMNRNNTGVALYDKSGKAFYSTGRAEHHDLLPVSKMSTNLVHATVASEDKDFYKHGGFSVLSTLRAVYGYVINRGGSFGGSTITQQLAKMTLLSSQRSVLRQYQAFSIAVAIENSYSKDQILAMYLNSVYFGESAFGVEDAAQTYFGTTPDKLTLAQSAMLIGLLPAPSLYSPISGDASLAKQRQKIVLDRMVANGYITQSQADTAASQKLTYRPQATQDSPAPHFAEMVLNELYDKYGQEAVLRSGYQVHTTLDLSLQKDLVKNVEANKANIDANGGSNASAIAIDPKTGEIRALVGSIDYDNKDWGKVNMVTSPRQPASTFKPIYYTAALESGVITPATMLDDEPINLNGWQPKDADRQWRGQVTVRQALDWSLNIPSIHVMQKYGVSESIAYANKLGVTDVKKDGDYGLTLAIGTAEVPLLQMVHAYSAFANGGEQYPVTKITSIADKYDKTIFEAKKSATRVVSQAGAYLISSILSDNTTRSVVFGSSLTVPGHTVAVKTGTTDNNKDALTIGYTPNLVLGVWVGNNDNTDMGAGGYALAGPIWKQTMIDTLADQPDQPFTVPNTVIQKSTCYSNHGIATNNITNGTYQEYYLSTALPSLTCAPVEPKITVCNIKTKKIESIDENTFDAKTYTKDTSKCKTNQGTKPGDNDKDNSTMEVCDTTTGVVVTIKKSDFDEDRYSKDIENCEVTTPTP